MLQVTSSAASTLVGARAQQGLPEHFGVRIYADPAPSPDTNTASYRLGFVEQPEAHDQVTETDGALVFVAPEVAGSLENAVLDAGATGHLVLTPQDS